MDLLKLAQQFQNKLDSSKSQSTSAPDVEKLKQRESLYNITTEMIGDLIRAKSVRVYTDLTDTLGEDSPQFFFGPGIKKYVKNWPPIKINQQNLGPTIYPFLPRGLQARMDYLIRLLQGVVNNLKSQNLVQAKQSLNQFKTDINSVWPIFSDDFRISLARPLKYIDITLDKLSAKI